MFKTIVIATITFLGISIIPSTAQVTECNLDYTGDPLEWAKENLREIEDTQCEAIALNNNHMIINYPDGFYDSTGEIIGGPYVLVNLDTQEAFPIPRQSDGRIEATERLKEIINLLPEVYDFLRYGTPYSDENSDQNPRGSGRFTMELL